MSEPVSARKTALVVGAIVGLVIGAVLTTSGVPSVALRALGGQGDGIARYGGLRLTWRPPAGVSADDVVARLARRNQVDVRHAGDALVIDIPHVAPGDADELAQQVGAYGTLEFHRVIESDTFAGFHSSLAAVEVDAWSDDSGRRHTDYYLSAPRRDQLEQAIAAARSEGLSLPPHAMIGYEQGRPELGDPSWRTYLLDDRVELDGDSIASAYQSSDPNTNRPIVLVDFDRDGAQRFGDVTARLVGRKLAMVLGDRVISAPVINDPIRGGRASIWLGGASPDRAERDARVLARALSAGSLPRGGTLIEAGYVAPEAQPGRLWAARGALAIVGGFVAALLAWLIVRFTRPEVRVIEPLGGTARSGTPLAWTIGVLLVMFAGSQLLVLPGVNSAAASYLINHAGGGDAAASMFGPFALGIQPLINAFVLVELAAVIVPRWRRLRHGGPSTRRTLGRAVAIVAIVMALVQAFFIASYLDSLSRAGVEIVDHPGLEFRLITMATLVGGTMITALLVSIIGHRGIGNGYAMIYLASWVAGVPFARLAERPVTALFALIAVATMAAIVWAIHRWRIARPGGVAIPLPASGIAPVSEAGGLALIAGQLLALGVLTMPGWLYELVDRVRGKLVFAIVVVIAMTIAWSLVFTRPGVRRDVLGRAGVAPPDRSSWLRATVLSAALLAALATIGYGALHVAGIGPMLDPIAVALAVTVVLDLFDELRDRRRGLIPVWPLHDPLLADVVRDKLAAAGIDHHLQSARLRMLLWFFGPWVPIMVMVPPQQAPDAERILRELYAA